MGQSGKRLNSVNTSERVVLSKTVFERKFPGGKSDLDLYIPANISYMFNYEENPNEGYFFIDLVEESGKLIKPPYDPKREGYKFDGWYKESECVNQWNFDTDEVKINYNEEGERIYEEITLFAKWTEV